MANAISIINSLKYNAYYLRTLGELSFDIDTIYAGNSAVVVRCYDPNSATPLLLKCYYHRRRNGVAIYGNDYKSAELGIISLSGHTEFIDVLIRPWAEGEPLDNVIGSKNASYRRLSSLFDKMALELLKSNHAHGDIKPDNIIVKPSGDMTLIDWDAAWTPTLSDSDVEECGTAIFCHPERHTQPFNKHIDDFSIALLSTTLAALAIDRKFFEPRLTEECSLFDPEDAIRGSDELLNHAIELFSRNNDAVHYRIATSIIGCKGPIYNLQNWLDVAGRRRRNHVATGYICRYGATWGIKSRGKWILPPLYDFIYTRDDHVKLCLGKHCHTISGSVSPESDHNTRTSSPKTWSIREEECLLLWYCDNYPIESIAKSLRRSPQAIRARLSKIIPKKDRPRIERLRTRARYR